MSYFFSVYFYVHTENMMFSGFYYNIFMFMFVYIQSPLNCNNFHIKTTIFVLDIGIGARATHKFCVILFIGILFFPLQLWV